MNTRVIPAVGFFSYRQSELTYLGDARVCYQRNSTMLCAGCYFAATYFLPFQAFSGLKVCSNDFFQNFLQIPVSASVFRGVLSPEGLEHASPCPWNNVNGTFNDVIIVICSKFSNLIFLFQKMLNLLLLFFFHFLLNFARVCQKCVGIWPKCGQHLSISIFLFEIAEDFAMFFAKFD